MEASPLHAAQQQDEENRDANVENGNQNFTPLSLN